MDGVHLENGSALEGGYQAQRRSRSKCLCVLSTTIHAALSVYYVFLTTYAFYVLYLALSSEEEVVSFMGKYSFAFGTNWNLTFQLAFVLISLTYDVLEWVGKHESSKAKKIAFWRDIVFNALVVPFTMFVSIMFWIVFTIDRELVFPEIYDAILPWAFNHCAHTNIAIVVLLETLLTARRYPTSRSVELKIHAFVTVGYSVVYYSVFFFTNRWLYNVFGVMTWWQVCLFQLLIWSSTFFFYFVHFPVNRIIHGCGPEDTEQKTSKDVNAASQDRNLDIAQKTDAFTKDAWSFKYRFADETSRL